MANQTGPLGVHGSSLAHEVLFALSGYAGEVIVDRADGSFAVAPSLDYIDASDRTLIDRLVACGALYRTICDFAATEHAVGAGMYHRALCIGIEEDVLKPYRAAIVTAEKEFVLDPELPLAHLHELVHQRAAVFRELARFIAQLSSGASRSVLRGAAMMDLLHEHAASTGVPALHRVMTGLFRRCYAVMLNQIITWSVHGTIVDPNGEFFIQRVAKTRRGGSSGRGGGGGGSGGGDHRSYTSGNSGSESSRREEARRRFDDDLHFISLRQMPQCCMSMRLAEVILFTGEAVRVARRATVTTGAPELDPAALADAASALRAVKVQPQQTFALESAFSAIKQLVARHTWSILVNAAELPSHLGALKDYFLLAKGDVWAAFIENAAVALLRDVPTKAPMLRSTERNLNAGALALAAQTCSCEDDPLFRRVSLALELPRIDIGSTDSADLQPADLVGPNPAEEEEETRRLVHLSQNLRNHGLEAAGQVDKPRFASAAAFRLGSGLAALSATRAGETSDLEASTRRRSGSVWTVRKQRVDLGFDCEFSFRLESPDARFAFVVQNTHRCPIGLVPSQRANVRLALGARRAAPAVSVAFHGDGVGILANDDYGRLNGLEGDAVPKETVDAHWVNYPGLAGGASHRARVVYAQVGGGGSAEGGEKRWELRLYLWRTSGRRPTDDRVAPLLLRTIDLRDRRHVAADLHCGCAWVGLCGSTDGGGSGGKGDEVATSPSRAAAAAAAAAAGSGVAVAQWTFESILDDRAAAEGTKMKTASVGFARAQVQPHAGGAERAARTATFAGLHLRYAVKWPLQLIITPSALERYNVLFKFLFRFKFVESSLKQAWGTLIHTPRATRTLRGGSSASQLTRRRLWFLRARMSFVVSNIIFYLQADVIEVQTGKLLQSLTTLRSSASREFESLRKAHERSLNNMVRLSFLQVREVRYAVDDVLRTCQIFCSAVQQGRGQPQHVPTEQRVVDLDRDFARQVHWLLLQLRGASAGSAAAARSLPRADALLLRLNFNGYWKESVAAYARDAAKTSRAAGGGGRGVK